MTIQQSNKHLSHQHETGQAIVLISFFMIILIGFLGLAIDGGGMFLMYRNAQNAVDAGLVAGSYAACTGGNVELAARRAVGENGFIDGLNDTNVTVNRPPTSGRYINNANAVQIIIHTEKPPFFIDFVYNGALAITVDGVAGCMDVNQNIYADQVLFATGTNCTNQLRSSGSNQYFEGGFFSNGSVQINSSDATITGNVTAAGDLQAMSNGGGYSHWPHVSIGGNSGEDQMDSITQLDAPIAVEPLYTWDQFILPDGEYAQQAQAAGMYYYYDNPGHFNWAQTNPNHRQYLPKEGLIVINGGFSASGSGAMVSGAAGLTIVATEKIQFSGNDIQLLKPYIEDLNLFSTLGYTPDDPNTAIYEPITNGLCSQKGIQWPSAGTQFNGLMYAPGSQVNVPTSSTSTPARGQIIAYSIGINVANINMIFGNSYLDPAPPSFGLFE